MIKANELTKAESCLNKAGADEWVFVLRAKDSCAPEAIRAWCQYRFARGLNVREDQKIIEALACADMMETQRKARWSEVEP
jgi:hypothetical protein